MTPYVREDVSRLADDATRSDMEEKNALSSLKKKRLLLSRGTRLALYRLYRLSRAAAASTYPVAAASESAAVHRARLAPRPPLA